MQDSNWQKENFSMQALYVEAEIPRARVAWTYFLNKIAVKRPNIGEGGGAVGLLVELSQALTRV